jgi:membrane protease YdiL (CAAX protease family)
LRVLGPSGDKNALTNPTDIAVLAPWRRPLAIALSTTALVTALSYLLPEDYSATGVGLVFLAVTYIVALRPDSTERVRHYGMSLGGLLEPEPLSGRRLLKATLGAVGWALGLAALTFPPFWVGFQVWYRPDTSFAANASPWLSDEALGQLLVIALPEEAFYRGYLQTALDDAWKPRWTFLKARFGVGLFAASALFAAGHLLTELHPNRLAVFFPALLFGWLRTRTGGIGAALVFHALCNLFASFLAASYGLTR